MSGRHIEVPGSSGAMLEDHVTVSPDDATCLRWLFKLQRTHGPLGQGKRDDHKPSRWTWTLSRRPGSAVIECAARSIYAFYEWWAFYPIVVGVSGLPDSGESFILTKSKTSFCRNLEKNELHCGQRHQNALKCRKYLNVSEISWASLLGRPVDVLPLWCACYHLLPHTSLIWPVIGAESTENQSIKLKLLALI